MYLNNRIYQCCKLILNLIGWRELVVLESLKNSYWKAETIHNVDFAHKWVKNIIEIYEGIIYWTRIDRTKTFT